MKDKPHDEESLRRAIEECAHISDEEIATDIADTQREIEGLEIQNRLDHSKIEARETGIRDRKLFILKLHQLRSARRLIREGKSISNAL